jgi:glutaredoxin-like YruB-family protein
MLLGEKPSDGIHYIAFLDNYPHRKISVYFGYNGADARRNYSLRIILEIQEVFLLITVYSSRTCPWCTKVKEYLEGKGVAFEVVDVAADREAAMDMVKKTGQMGVPVTKIGDRYIVGYNPEAIDEEIANIDK